MRGAGTGLPRLVTNGRFLVQETTGVQRVACEVTREIDRMLARGEMRADVELLCPPGRRVQHLDLTHVRVRNVGHLRGMLWEQAVLPRHLDGATLLCLGNTAPLAALALGEPVAVMIHDLSFLYYPGAYRRRYRIGHRLMLPLLARGASRLFTVSAAERERIRETCGDVAGEIVVVQNGGWADDAVAPRAPPPQLPERYALYVGSLSHRKNFGRILAAAIRLAREDGLDFVFVGSHGKVLRPPDLRVPPDVADRIHFVGQINDRARLGQVYAGASVLLFPSLYEASPLPPLEAARFGCPVVASNIPSIWERCGEGVTYCNPRSLDSIVGAVREVLADPDAARAKLAELQRHASGWSWQAQARAICRSLIPTAFRDDPGQAA